jgi:membrane-associated HD superfamily phosphohydrolase
MTLLELQDVLGERILIAKNPNLSIDEKNQENELSKTISSLAKQMINNADIVLRTDRLIAEGKANGSNIVKLVNGDGKQNE